MAHRYEKSTDSERDRESRMAVEFWTWHRGHAGRFRSARRGAIASGTAGLPGHPIHRERMVHQETTEAHPAVANLSNGEWRRCAKRDQRLEKRLPLEIQSAAPGCRGISRFVAGHQRQPGPHAWRRAPLSARDAVPLYAAHTLL